MKLDYLELNCQQNKKVEARNFLTRPRHFVKGISNVNDAQSGGNTTTPKPRKCCRKMEEKISGKRNYKRLVGRWVRRGLDCS